MARKARMTLGRGLGAVGLLFLALVVVALAIAQDQETLRVRSAIPSDDPRALSYVAKLVGASVSGGNTYRVLTNGDEIFPAMLTAINTARRRIALETYIYEDGIVADSFTTALEGAAKRGVEVSFVVDSVGSTAMSEAHVKRLEAAGAKVASFNESHWYALEEINYRTHRKLLVVDGDVAFTGGVGVSDHWQGNAQDPDHWRDTMVEMRGPIARQMEGAFYENFIEAHDVVTPPVDHEDVKSATPAGDALIVRSAPSGGSSDLKRLYLLNIALAQRTLDVQSPYFITDSSSLWSIEEARKRGVRVRILMESDLTDAKPVKYASRRRYDHLLEIGCELYEYQPTMMHAKVMVVDGLWSMTGSANFDNRSLELNDELNVLVHNEELAARLTGDFERDLTRSRRITLDDWRQRPYLDRVRELFWSWFGEVF